MDLAQNSAKIVTELPVRVMTLEFSNVADPPDLIADPVLFFVLPFQFSAADLLAKIDRFQHRTIAMPAAADVVNLARSRRANEFSERFHEIETVNVVAHLFAFVAEHAIGALLYGADHEIRKKSVELGAGLSRAGQAATAK